MNPWTPTREWDGQDAFIIGGGASLIGFDFSSLTGRRVIGCNDAFRLGPTVVQICCFADVGWWHKNKWELEKFPNRIVTNSNGMENFDVPGILNMKRVRDGFHTGDTLGFNASTGAVALNLAVLLGAARVFLLGFDMCLQGKDHHWHTHQIKGITQESFSRHIQGFATLKASLPPEVQVFNVSDGTSKLRVFPCVNFQVFQSVLHEREVLV